MMDALRIGPTITAMRKYCHLVAWQRANEATLTVFREAQAHYHPWSRVLLDQLRSATLSVDLNIVEGCALGSRPLFRRHVRIAIGSAAEAQRITQIARQLDYSQPRRRAGSIASSTKRSPACTA